MENNINFLCMVIVAMFLERFGVGFLGFGVWGFFGVGFWSVFIFYGVGMNDELD